MEQLTKPPENVEQPIKSIESVDRPTKLIESIDQPSRWFFATGEDYLWYWKETKFDERDIIKQSEQGFDNFQDCRKDANKNGHSEG